MLTLSVIAPAFNQENCIVPFLQSVAAQTWRDFEFIIIDDGSSDRTAELIEAHLPRLGSNVLFIRHQQNQGEMATATEAFAKASGQICLKLDADGVFAPDTFARIMESFADEGVGIVTGLVRAAERSSWVLRGAELLYAARQQYDQLDEQCTAIAYGNCFALRRHLFSIQEVLLRTDIDLSRLARKRGWKIVLRDDVVIHTRFPATPWAAFAWGRRKARQDLAAYRHHKGDLLTDWVFWLKFAPLALLLSALFKPKLALGGLLAWLGGSQVFLARFAPACSWADRLAAWGVSLLRWSGFDLEALGMAVRGLIERRGRGNEPG